MDVGEGAMKIHVYSIMFNEEFMLPYFLRHYETIADQIFVWEDQSTDNTRAILSQHPKVTLLETPEVHGIHEGYWITKLWPRYKELSRGQADYVICVDTDELAYHPGGLVGVLEEQKRFGVQLIHCRGYTMMADAPPTTTSQIYDEIKLGVRDRWSSKWCVFSPEIELEFQRGRHGYPRVAPDIVWRKEIGARLLHYRYLGHRYFEQRDARNAQRIGVAEGRSRDYSSTARHNLPDGTRGVPLPWYESNLVRAVDVTV